MTGRQVSKDEFFKTIGPRDIVSEIVGKYPYTSVFRLRNLQSEIGRIVDYLPEKSGLIASSYYLTGRII